MNTLVAGTGVALHAAEAGGGAARALVPMALLSALLAGCRGPVAAPQPGAGPRGDAALGALLEGVRAETGVPGIAAGVFDRDGAIATAASGVRRVGEEAPLEPTDRFHLGSNTKAMTAFVVARLVERGKLSWETTLAEGFPEWRDSMDAAYRAVPIGELLRHRAGIAALMKEDAWLGKGIHSWQSLPAQRWILARNALHHPPAVPPGTFLYSNAGYVVAGALVEKVLGEPWEEVIREEIFLPLGMGSCGFGPPARGRERGQPFGHVLRGARWEPDDGDVPPALGPAGTVACTLADWAAFARANMDRAPDGLVHPATLARLHEPLPADWHGERIGYAMGWMTWESPADGLILAHHGSNDRSFATVRLSPRRGLAYLVAVNAGGDGASRAAARAVEVISRRYGQGRAQGPP